MTTFGKGPRSGCRKMLRASKRKKFKVEPLLWDFSEGERVVVKQDPSSQGGMPHRRYKGKVGIIRSKRGWAYVIDMKLGGKEKQIIANPEHLKLIKH